MSGKKKGISTEDAMAVLQAENEKKLKAFAKDYEELCKKHGMEISPQVKMTVRPLEQLQ